MHVTPRVSQQEDAIKNVLRDWSETETVSVSVRHGVLSLSVLIKSIRMSTAYSLLLPFPSTTQGLFKKYSLFQKITYSHLIRQKFRKNRIKQV